jgi:hypothetical protein
MVNAGMVNALTAPVPEAYFCIFLPVFARIALFENSVKYNRIFDINHAVAYGGTDAGDVSLKTHDISIT